MATCYELLEPESLPWAEYGDTVRALVHGTYSGGGRSGPLRLQRAGPSVPPFSFPGLFAIVVTNDTRRRLERSRLTGLQFREVVKERIVEIPWQDWVFGHPPLESLLHSLFREPGVNEPEDLVVARPHSRAAARKAGRLWELTPPLQGKLRRRRERPVLKPELFEATDFVRFDDDWEQILVSERAKDWLQSRYEQWLSFRPRD